MAHQSVILLERVDNLGEIGETVSVKPGYARNFLIPQGKALRATSDNIAYFEGKRKELEAANAKAKDAAEKDAKKLEGKTFAIIRQASEAGQMYGSVAARDIAAAASEGGIEVKRNQVILNTNLKMIGLFPIEIALHPEVKVEVTINIARSEEEAKTQAETGVALIARDDDDIEEQPIAETASEEKLEEVFEDEAVANVMTQQAEDAAAEAEAEEKAKAEKEAQAKAYEAKKAEEEAAAAEAEAADSEAEAETETAEATSEEETK